MLRTEFVSKEEFTYNLKKVNMVKTPKEVRKKRRFGYDMVQVMEDKPIYEHDEEKLKSFPTDVQEYIRGLKKDKYGFIEQYSKSNVIITRSITNTINDFYKWHKISKSNIIDMTYRMGEREIHGVFITWEAGEL